MVTMAVARQKYGRTRSGIRIGLTNTVSIPVHAGIETGVICSVQSEYLNEPALHLFQQAGR